VVVGLFGWNAKPVQGSSLPPTQFSSATFAKLRHAPYCTLRDGVFRNGSRAGNQIALTFDACPRNHNPAFAADVVDLLESMQVPATFFVSGKWADDNPGALARLTGQPYFEIAMHGYRHPHMADATPAQIRDEMEQGRAALLRHGVTPAPFFRAPYGDNPPGLASVAISGGALAVMGDGGLGDPDPKRTAAILQRDGIRWLQAGSIIILHVNGGGYATAETVAGLVPLLRARGYRFVRISDLVNSCAAGH
jgi:peptidoglycan/xylan/chitin deacetylase (PgdA/CDA1 family)